jgi:hypothetical protein
MKVIGLAAGDGRHGIFPFPKVSSVPTKDRARVHTDARRELPARIQAQHFPCRANSIFG